MIKNERGIALVIVLILSAIALALVGITLSLIRYSTNVSGSYSAYKTSLEAAKGGVDLSMAKLLNTNCDNSSMSGNLSISPSTLGQYSIKATVLNKLYYPTIDEKTGTITDHCIYSLEVTASSTKSKDKSIIDVVIKVD